MQQQQLPTVVPQQPQQQQPPWNNNMGATPMLDQNAMSNNQLDDGLGATAAASTSYNQKTSERMRQDEGN